MVKVQAANGARKRPSADDLESLNETSHALRTPGLVDELCQADSDYAAGNTVSGDD